MCQKWEFIIRSMLESRLTLSSVLLEIHMHHPIYSFLGKFNQKILHFLSFNRQPSKKTKLGVRLGWDPEKIRESYHVSNMHFSWIQGQNRLERELCCMSKMEARKTVTFKWTFFYRKTFSSKKHLCVFTRQSKSFWNIYVPLSYMLHCIIDFLATVQKNVAELVCALINYAGVTF